MHFLEQTKPEQSRGDKPTQTARSPLLTPLAMALLPSALCLLANSTQPGAVLQAFRPHLAWR